MNERKDLEARRIYLPWFCLWKIGALLAWSLAGNERVQSFPQKIATFWREERLLVLSPDSGSELWSKILGNCLLYPILEERNFVIIFQITQEGWWPWGTSDKFRWICGGVGSEPRLEKWKEFQLPPKEFGWAARSPGPQGPIKIWARWCLWRMNTLISTRMC